MKINRMIFTQETLRYTTRNRRVRAILLTDDTELLFIKRVKPNKPPYRVAPGGGMEEEDASLLATLHRELDEELGAEVEVLEDAFILLHEKAGKQLEEHFYVCRLLSMDLTRRHGPEFDDPEKGLYIPDFVPLNVAALDAVEIKTPELRDWLLDHLEDLRLTV
ncbi:MAG: NUDIX domain-containing protein [Aggregatilineales bacterium]